MQREHRGYNNRVMRPDMARKIGCGNGELQIQTGKWKNLKLIVCGKLNSDMVTGIAPLGAGIIV